MKSKKQSLSAAVLTTGLFIACLMILSCAKQGYPPGGPEDRRGPTILSTEPSPDSTGVVPHVRPYFRFDEHVDRVSVEMATFVSPLPDGKIRFKWRGKSVQLVFPEPLQQDMTYVITLGTGIRDLRGNPLPMTYTLAFSTGETLNKAAVSGRIYGESGFTGIQIWAYSLDVDPDPDPAMKGPDYITQADETGYFLLSHLREGTYRIFAVQDHRRNRIWDPDADRIGISFMDVETFQDAVSSGADMRMSLQDTTGAWIQSVRVPDRNHLLVRFSEPVQASPLAQISIRDSADISLDVISYFPDPIDSVSWKLITETQHPEHRYFLWADGFVDNVGNMNLPDSMMFEGSGLPDTVGPHLLEYSPENLERNVPDLPVVRVVFDEEIAADSVPVLLFGTPDLRIPYDWQMDGSILYVIPTDSMAEMDSIQVHVDLNAIGDRFGNQGADSILTWSFSILPRDTLGEILGSINDLDTTVAGLFVLEAERLDGSDDWHGVWEVDATGIFDLEWMLPGQYRLKAFRDEDQSGDYSYGYPHPFSPAERFVFYPDTVTVRSRWETAGIVITLPLRQPKISQPELTDTLKVTP